MKSSVEHLQGILKRPRLRGAIIVATALVVCWTVLKPPLTGNRPFGRAIYDRNGQLLRLILAEDDRYRLRVPLSKISPKLIEATMLYEDRWFYRHPGFNPVALVKAALQTYVHKGQRRGGSTITMQLARLVHDMDSTTPWGKIKQVCAAVLFELHYSKDEILEAYLNIAPYGGNIEGAYAASLIYFGKEPSELSLAEASALAVMPQNPARREPGARGVEPPGMLTARRRLARQWLDEHPGADEKELSITGPLAMRSRADLPFEAPHLVTDVERADYTSSAVTTTLDLPVQKSMERIIASYVERRRNIGVKNAAAMLVDHRSMEVLGLVGSADFFDPEIQGQVNGAKAPRSPGSALKPFIYALAMEQGVIHPRSILKDAPMRFGAYNPENFDNEFRGPQSATVALINSRNVPAVDLTTQLRGSGFYGFLSDVGIGGLKHEGFYGLAVVLGGVEVTMEELVGLYAMLANDGRLKPLRYATDDPAGGGREVLKPEAAFLTLDMLAANTRPGQRFESQWVHDPVVVSWKTGTSYAFRDAWAVGVVGPYVLAVWLGNFDGTGNPVFVGREAAGPLFFEIIDALRAIRPFDARRPEPSKKLNLARVNVCPVSGKLPGPHCTHTAATWFIPGTSPIKKCDIHRPVYVDNVTGLRACDANAATTRTEVYEFWSSDLDKLFARAGMPRKKPPPYLPACRLDDRAARGIAPHITSPQSGVVYSVRAHETDKQTIPLAATADADVKWVHWFINEEYVGKAARDESLFWKARPGTFSVRAVDDSGRAGSRVIQVAVVE